MVEGALPEKSQRPQDPLSRFAPAPPTGEQPVLWSLRDANGRLIFRVGEAIIPEETVSFGTLPIGASVARPSAMLGLTPACSLWENEDWAIEKAETDAPGSPYGRGWTEDADDERSEAAAMAEADPP